MKLYIADDEIDVREGIRYLIDWSALGFFICGEGKNGQETLTEILQMHPDIVLLDIRMPKLSGLEVIRQAREAGFSGKFIILSGYSDFAYAQEAMRFGVNCYLTKPIDEDELEKAILDAKAELLAKQSTQKKLVQYRDKARESILKDILLDRANDSFLDYQDISLEANIYQVILYTNYNQDSLSNTWDFAEILRLANRNHNSLDSLHQDGQNIIILKGNHAVSRFEDLLKHYSNQPQKSSPLDSLFLTYGRPIYSVEEIHISYEEAILLMRRRFFCSFNQHVIGYRELPHINPKIEIDEKDDNYYAAKISGYIQSGNHHMLLQTMEELKEDLYNQPKESFLLKHYLADTMIQVKSILSHTYTGLELPFLSNAEIISTIEEKYYLYEILDFFTAQFETCMNTIGSPSRESVMEGILEYIQHNYRENLKLGNIAKLFGYNSSYLGKLFTKTMNKSFNSYLDEVRIENSKRLLTEGEYKVYEISQMVGYTNVDYFHKKFKKYVGMSPAEYRKEK